MGKVQIIEKLFLYIAIYSYLILPISLFFCKDKKGFPLIIAIYGILAFAMMRLFEHLSLSLQYIYLIVYTLIEYLFFAFFLYISIKNRKLKYLILGISVSFALFQLIVGSNAHRLDSVSIGIETILLFIFIFLFFYDHSKNIKAGYIYYHPTFMISVGILVYLGLSFFFNILANYMSEAEFAMYWHYTYIAEIIKNIFFAVAILMTSRHNKIPSLRQTQVPYLDMDIN